MANALYDNGRNAFLEGDIDWTNDSISIELIDTALYTVDLANHQFRSSVPAGSRIANVALTSKTSVAGVADAADAVFTTVSGAESEAIIIYKNTGNEATDNLIGYIDNATGLPVTPNGGDITVTWDNGANKIFKL